MKRLRFVTWFSAWILLISCADPIDVWVEESFEDFRDGVFDAAGQNLYVTRKGQIKTIHRFDLNGDGFQDLVFNSSHDFVTGPKPTVYTLGVGRATGRASDLPVFGTSRAVAADLDKDGFPDLVLLPNNNWVSPKARRYAEVFWGGKDGWSGARMTGLITIEAMAVDSGDLDGDGWPDLVILNGSRWAPEEGPGCFARVHWGSNEGFRQEEYQDVSLGRAADLAVRDMDSDGRPEIVVLENPADRPTSTLRVYWNDGIRRGKGLPPPVHIPLHTESVGRMQLGDLNRDGRLDFVINGVVREVIGRDPTTGEERYRYSGLLGLMSEGTRGFSPAVKNQTRGATAFTLADFDGDGQLDVAVADSGAKENSVTILRGRPKGSFHEGSAVRLPVGYASALATADLDGDGNQDIVVGIFQTEETYQADSRVFWGDGKGGFKIGDALIPTSAVKEIVVAPTGFGSGRQLVFLNNISGQIKEGIPVDVYWGMKRGFSPDNVSRYHIRAGYSSNAADLNDDGYPDLILTSLVHNVVEQHSEVGFNILWGGSDDFVDERRTIVSEYGAYTGSIADLDRDGYLDLVGGCNQVNSEGEPRRMAIWYGGENGFAAARRSVLPVDGTSGTHILADLNRDGWLDIAVARYMDHRVSIFWGAPGGFSKKREFSMALPSPGDIAAADLNKDGWLDLVITTMTLPGTLHYDFGSYIFWGSEAGFRQSNSQRLRSSFGVGVSVADYDGDGYLDINIPTYKWSDIREGVQDLLYWGGSNGYSDEQKTIMLIDSGHGTQSADFDGDGLIDLAISAHSLDGNHRTDSRVYYNDGNRFKAPRVQLLPTRGPHYMHRADVGHQYDRSYRQTYVSSRYEWEKSRAGGELWAKATTPGGSKLTFLVRSAADASALEAAPWTELERHDFRLAPADRCLQYRAVFSSDNGDRYPVLDRVEIRFYR